MRAVSTTSSAAYQIHYHFVVPVKYRRGVFGLADREQTLLAICREIEERYGIRFERIGADVNHVHWLLSAEPQLAPSRVIQVVKSITAREMFARHPGLRRELWGGHLWSEGYFVATVGEGGSKQAIERYIESQGHKPEDVQLKIFDF